LFSFKQASIAHQIKNNNKNKRVEKKIKNRQEPVKKKTGMPYGKCTAKIAAKQNHQAGDKKSLQSKKDKPMSEEKKDSKPFPKFLDYFQGKEQDIALLYGALFCENFDKLMAQDADTVKKPWTASMIFRYFDLTFAVQGRHPDGMTLYKIHPTIMPLPSQLEALMNENPTRCKAYATRCLAAGDDLNKEDFHKFCIGATKGIFDHYCQVWREWAMLKQIDGHTLDKDEQKEWESGRCVTAEQVLVQDQLAGSKDPMSVLESEAIRKEVFERTLSLGGLKILASADKDFNLEAFAKRKTKRLVGYYKALLEEHQGKE